MANIRDWHGKLQAKTYRSESSTTATTVRLFREFPRVAIKQRSKDSLGNLGRSQEQLGSSWERQGTEVCEICGSSIDCSK